MEDDTQRMAWGIQCLALDGPVYCSLAEKIIGKLLHSCGFAFLWSADRLDQQARMRFRLRAGQFGGMGVLRPERDGDEIDAGEI